MAFVDFNHLVDDDGTGTVGTLWDVAETRGLLLGTCVGRTDVGTVNNWLSGVIAGHTYIEWNGASDLTVTGFAGGGVYLGQEITFRNIGPAVAYFAGSNAGSLAANRLWNPSTVCPTVPVAHGGFVRYRYGPQSTWMLVAHEQGAWIAQPYAAGNYTASGSMTWTVDAGDVTAQRWRLAGLTLQLAFYLATTTIGGTASTSLFLALPAGFKVASAPRSVTPIWVLDGTGAGAQIAIVAGNATLLELQRMNQGAWPLGINNTYLSGNVAIEIP
jgi:hypothetical protein